MSMHQKGGCSSSGKRLGASGWYPLVSGSNHGSSTLVIPRLWAGLRVGSGPGRGGATFHVLLDTNPYETYQVALDGMAEIGCFQLCRKVVSLSPIYQAQPPIIKQIHHHKRPFESSFRWPVRPTLKYPHRFSSNTNDRFRVNSVKDSNGDQTTMSASSAYQVLDVLPDCSLSDLKAAFRAKVKQFHPDVRKSDEDDSSDTKIRLVIQAYEVLSNLSKSEIIERHVSLGECLDPFDAPECEAFDIFVNEVLCAGKGCPCSCVKTAPHAFAFSSSTGTARATSQGHAEDYQVQLAVGQCPRSCIHYVTPSQRVILEELLGSILNVPFDCSAEAELLYALIVKAKFENNRYRKPKKQPNVSTKHVDWY
ncbi:hypothetical protein OSB04_016829 [Centaurea solstitialis]|uniref:J domain-containing protein n=1 Tax=Centaurea solstitialis TaxID=347529 RepID=A0AA38WK46_9ASTR|nr:hypothetical protein OSB04_016829 [Centaurea solstitialis]